MGAPCCALPAFNGLFSRTTWVSRYQKDKTSQDLNEMMGFGMQWHWLDHMQTIYASRQTDNHINTLKSLNFYRLFLTPKAQCQSTEGNNKNKL